MAKDDDLITEFAKCITTKFLVGNIGFDGYVFCEKCLTNGFAGGNAEIFKRGTRWPMGVVPHDDNCTVGKAEKILMEVKHGR